MRSDYLAFRPWLLAVRPPIYSRISSSSPWMHEKSLSLNWTRCVVRGDHTGGQKCMSFAAVQPSNKKVFFSEMKYPKHRSPPPGLCSLISILSPACASMFCCWNYVGFWPCRCWGDLFFWRWLHYTKTYILFPPRRSLRNSLCGLYRWYQ